MSQTIVLKTEHLILRHWCDADLIPFAQLNRDPRVMERMPSMLTREQSDAMANRIRKDFEEHGFGLYAVERPGIAPFIGFVGFAIPRFEAAFTPCVEIGWRLAADHWGQGLATEGAQAVLEAGFTRFGLDEVVSFTTPGNWRSIRVMEKIGLMRNPADDFEHPTLPKGHHLSLHVLYRLTKAQWEHQAAGFDPTNRA